MKELIEKYMSIWNSNGIALLDQVLTKNSTYWDPTQHGNAIATLTGSITATHEAFSDISFQIIDLSATSYYQFFLEWHMTATNTGTFFGNPPTGKCIDIQGLDCIKLDSNKIVSIRSFYDSGLFGQQLGLQ